MAAPKPTNWAGNITFSVDTVVRPTSIDELRQLVSTSQHVRALGTGHSFNTIADTDGLLVSVAGLAPDIEVDSDGHSVRVAAGLRYADVTAALNAKGFALRNLGSLPHISVSGACATATHGSGNNNGNLSTAVSELEIVTADGDLVTISRDTDAFAGCVVSLGALGIVTRMTLDVVPAFEIQQVVYEDLALDVVADHVDDIFGAAYSVSVFTDWGAADSQLWVKSRDLSSTPTERFGATAAEAPRHPVPGASPIHCTQQLGQPGPWNERLPHFRPDFTPSSGAELQAEYLISRIHAAEAIGALRGIADLIQPVLQISEIRTVAADDLWLSPSYGRDSVCLHFTFIPDTAAVVPVLKVIEDLLAPFDPRPHWGKLFAMSPEAVRETYERFSDFQSLAAQWDPRGKFRNAFLDRLVPALG